MSPLTKSLLVAALTLPLAAFVAGVLSAPEDFEEDRSRPVIIGRVSDDDQAVREETDRDDHRDRKQRQDRDDGRDRDTDDRPDGPSRGTDSFTVVTPVPRDLDDDDDGVDDDDDGGDTDDASDDSDGDD
jgi:hypothetical protein